MPNWFYFDKSEKKGPFSSEELFSLAASGKIRWGTIVETEDGRQTLAKNVKGLFPTQETATKPFVPVPPGALPPVTSLENQGVPPVVELSNPLRKNLEEEKEELSLASVSSEVKKAPLASLKFFLAGCCLSCFLLCCSGIYFACEAVRERETAEEKIEEYSNSVIQQVNAYVGGDAYNYIINGTYFTAYSIRSLQCTVQSSVCFLLAGMFGVTAIWLFFR